MSQRNLSKVITGLALTICRVVKEAITQMQTMTYIWKAGQARRELSVLESASEAIAVHSVQLVQLAPSSMITPSLLANHVRTSPRTRTTKVSRRPLPTALMSAVQALTHKKSILIAKTPLNSRSPDLEA